MSDILRRGYHGTTRQNKENILETGIFHFEAYNVKKNDSRIPNDLGAGAYFFCDSLNLNGKELAFEYSKKYNSEIIRKQNSSVDIVTAEIECNEENLLDLDEEGNIEDFIEAREIFEYQVEQQLKRTRNDKAKERDNRDGIYIELLIKKLEQSGLDIKIVSKRTYTPIKQKKSNFPNGLELCVRDIKIIKSIS